MKYKIIAIAPQGRFSGKPFEEENLKKTRSYLKQINDLTYICLEDEYGNTAFFSKQMISRTVFTIQPVEE